MWNIRKDLHEFANNVGANGKRQGLEATLIGELVFDPPSEVAHVQQPVPHMARKTMPNHASVPGMEGGVPVSRKTMPNPTAGSGAM